MEVRLLCEWKRALVSVPVRTHLVSSIKLVCLKLYQYSLVQHHLTPTLSFYVGVAIEHDDFIGNVSLEGMTESEFSDRVFHK